MHRTWPSSRFLSVRLGGPQSRSRLEFPGSPEPPRQGPPVEKTLSGILASANDPGRAVEMASPEFKSVLSKSRAAASDFQALRTGPAPTCSTSWTDPAPACLDRYGAQGWLARIWFPGQGNASCRRWPKDRRRTSKLVTVFFFFCRTSAAEKFPGRDGTRTGLGPRRGLRPGVAVGRHRQRDGLPPTVRHLLRPAQRPCTNNVSGRHGRGRRFSEKSTAAAGFAEQPRTG